MSDWIVATRFSIFLQNLPGMVPFTQTLHIFAIAILLSSVAVVDLRILGLLRRRRPLKAIIDRFMPATWGALGLLIVTGALLISVEPGRSLLAGQFQLKMGFLLLTAPMTAIIQNDVRRRVAVAGDTAEAPAGVRALALISMSLWLMVIFAGRWIAYA